MNGRLKYLSENYFHEDFLDEFSTAEGAMLGFKARESASSIADVVADIDEVLASSRNEAEIASLWQGDLYSYYVPEYDGLTCRQWFERMRDLLVSPTA